MISAKTPVLLSAIRTSSPVNIPGMANIADPEKWYKQFWPWFLIILPATVIIGCIISIVIAFKHADPVVQGDYAQHGLTVLHKTSSPADNDAAKDDAH